jgi:hypothetical protein
VVGNIQRIALLFHDHNDLDLKCQSWVLLVEHRQSDQLRQRVPRNPIARLRIDECPLADLAVDFIPDAVLSHDEFGNGRLCDTVVRMGQLRLICHHYRNA